CSSVVHTSSSSKSHSAFDMVFGGLGSEIGFLLKFLKGFLEEVSATCFFISTISLAMVLSTFFIPSSSKGSLVLFFFN
ncbi:hypothetical protein, partial [Escherichia coli]|uniref:hypothetical protein n=1 Tax=Escherichia coli TaxID=562 RepID=UPI00292E4EF5